MRRIKPGKLVRLSTTNPMIAILEKNALGYPQVAMEPWPTDPVNQEAPDPIDQFVGYLEPDNCISYGANEPPLLYLGTKTVSMKLKERKFFPMIPPEPGTEVWQTMQDESGFVPPYDVHRFLRGEKIFYFTTNAGESLEDYFVGVE